MAGVGVGKALGCGGLPAPHQLFLSIMPRPDFLAALRIHLIVLVSSVLSRWKLPIVNPRCDISAKMLRQM